MNATLGYCSAQTCLTSMKVKKESQQSMAEMKGDWQHEAAAPAVHSRVLPSPHFTSKTFGIGVSFNHRSTTENYLIKMTLD